MRGNKTSQLVNFRSSAFSLPLSHEKMLTATFRASNWFVGLFDSAMYPIIMSANSLEVS